MLPMKGFPGVTRRPGLVMVESNNKRFVFPADDLMIVQSEGATVGFLFKANFASGASFWQGSSCDRTVVVGNSPDSETALERFAHRYNRVHGPRE